MMWSEAGLGDVARDRLEHMYGTATDTPRHLRNLQSAEAKDRDSALLHLGNQVLHQGSFRTTAGPVVTLVAEMLPGNRLALRGTRSGPCGGCGRSRSTVPPAETCA